MACVHGSAADLTDRPSHQHKAKYECLSLPQNPGTADHSVPMRRSHVPSRLSVVRWRCQFWADCTTNISERKFPTGTGGSAQRPTGARRCGAGVRAGRIVFGTTADGGTIPTERLRIDNAGRV